MCGRTGWWLRARSIRTRRGSGGKHPRRLALAAMALRLGSPHEGPVARPDPDEPVDGDHPRRRPSPSPSRRPSRPPPHGRRSGTRASTPGESHLSVPPNPIRFPQIRSLGPGRRLEMVTNPPETPRSMKPSRQSNHSGPRGLSSSWFCPGSSWGFLLISGSKVRVLDGPPIESGTSGGNLGAPDCFDATPGASPPTWCR
jgi:hypothetical protein